MSLLDDLWEAAKNAVVTGVEVLLGGPTSGPSGGDSGRRAEHKPPPAPPRTKGRKRKQSRGGAAEDRLTRVENMLEELEQRLSEKYTFTVFAADSSKNEAAINFGILVNYQQAWKPIEYQVGELVKTIPLAPKESRRFSSKRVVKKSRSVREIENALRIKKEDSTDTYRDHAEITRKAVNKTNYDYTAEGGVQAKLVNVESSQAIKVSSSRHSSDVKKRFREAVLKSAEEYRSENKLDVTTTSSEEYEEATSGEISNPNDELAVTYLFYELQRRYEISEKIRKITPVILVANEVPRPDEIDEDWLLVHDWILRRSILDDSFLPALSHLHMSAVGDEISVEVLCSNFEMQLEVVSAVQQQIATHARALSEARTAMDVAVSRYAGSQAQEGILEKIGGWLFGSGSDDPETRRIRMEAAKEAFERAERKEKELRSRLEAEVTALQSAAEEYAKALQEQFNRKTQILRLRAHVKDNILHYMQAIWDNEPRDQRFFRLHDLEVPDLEETPGVTLEVVPVKSTLSLPFGIEIEMVIGFTLEQVPDLATRKLVEIADLENLLGYKGNYMIFPLEQNNVVTMFMTQDYINLNVAGRLWDPDEWGNYTVDEMIELIKCHYEENPDAFTDEVKDRYRDLLMKRLSDPYHDKDTIVVPTDSLYIEALPGKHPILEDFKLVHRAVDVKKVQSEVRHDELENLRLAARLLEGEYGDADIEKKIVIEGESRDVNVTTDS